MIPGQVEIQVTLRILWKGYCPAGTQRRVSSIRTTGAILYCTNAQIRYLRNVFITANIPYKIFGRGVNFYARKEVKGLLAYSKTIDNGNTDLAVRRIISDILKNVEMGAASINKAGLYG